MSSTNDNLSLRLPTEKREKIDEIAHSMDRSRNWLLNEIVSDYIGFYESQTELIKKRLKEAQNGGQFVSFEDTMREIEQKYLK